MHHSERFDQRRTTDHVVKLLMIVVLKRAVVNSND